MILTVHLKPGARENKIVAWLDKDTLKVTVKAPPEKGKANAALIDLLAKELHLSKSSLELTRGRTTHIKQILVRT